LTLLGREAIRALASIERGLLHPVPDRLGGGLELPAQLLWRSSLPHQLNEPRPKLWRVRSMALRHRGRSFPPQLWGVHETGATPQRAQTSSWAAAMSVSRSEWDAAVGGLGCHRQRAARPRPSGTMTVTATPEARSLGERRAMNSETLKFRSLAGVRTLARHPGLVSAFISAPESH